MKYFFLNLQTRQCCLCDSVHSVRMNRHLDVWNDRQIFGMVLSQRFFDKQYGRD